MTRMAALPAPGSLDGRPMAGGLPLSEATADEAAAWLTLLMSGEASEDDRHRWQRWRSAHPDHERAWTHIEAVTGRFKHMVPGAAYQALSPYAKAAPASPGRRQALNLLLWGGLAGTAGLLALRTPMGQQALAQHRTGTGEQRDLTLADGTRITLNTGSAVDLRFDARQRRLRLVAGEVMVLTAPDARPFIVDTAEGSIRALGTRFTVRQWEGRTSVAVLESAVEITPLDATTRPAVLRAGERTSFTRGSWEAASALAEQDAAWTRGQIVADGVRLGDFMAELGRYRRGFVQCDPAVADLRFSGVFPLHDTDRILSTLPNVLPVQVRLRTRYWVTVEAAP
jgi:transmembrane sensor